MTSSQDLSKVPVKDASTVVLLRDGAGGIEVFLQRRVRAMAFAGGMTVFPGGSVDASDAETPHSWAGPDIEWWARRFDTSAQTAQALVVAAVRELFEECGVLLAGNSQGETVSDVSAYEPARGELERHEISLAGFLQREGLTLRTDLLRPWANWITPLGERRRYDTRFFIAVLPAGQEPDDKTTETDFVQWQTPGAAIAHWKAGGSVLLPPTWSTLDSLTAYPSTAEAFAAEPDIPPIGPILHRTEDGIRLEFPRAADYFATGKLTELP